MVRRKMLAELVESEEVPRMDVSGGTKLSSSPVQDKENIPKNKKVKKLSRRQLEKLILEHREHGRRLAWSFLSSWRIRMNQDEVMSVVGMALCEAADRFDVSRGVAFKTFFFYHLRGMLLKEISKVIQEQKVLQSVPETIASSPSDTEQYFLSKGAFSLVENNNPERIIQKRQLSSMCWEACAELDPLEQEVVVRYFVCDEPLITIARELDYCRCHISRVKSRALSKLGRTIKDVLGAEESEGEAKLPLANRIEVTRSNDLRKRTSYTGGRGRRRFGDYPQKSETLTKILAQAY